MRATEEQWRELCERLKIIQGVRDEHGTMNKVLDRVEQMQLEVAAYRELKSSGKVRVTRSTTIEGLS